jgi:HAMP domain-containing protein
MPGSESPRDLLDLNELLSVLRAIRNGDASRRMIVPGGGLDGEIADVVNGIAERLGACASEIDRVTREIGCEGRFGPRTHVPGVSGAWQVMTAGVDRLSGNLTSQLRDIALQVTALANGDFTRKVTVDARGEVEELKQTLNTMVDQLNTFASEITRVVRAYGTDEPEDDPGEVRGLSGTWKDLIFNVNHAAAVMTD